MGVSVPRYWTLQLEASEGIEGGGGCRLYVAHPLPVSVAPVAGLSGECGGMEFVAEAAVLN